MYLTTLQCVLSVICINIILGSHLATCSDCTWKREKSDWMWAQKKGGRSGGDYGLRPSTGHSTASPQ